MGTRCRRCRHDQPGLRAGGDGVVRVLLGRAGSGVRAGGPVFFRYLRAYREGLIGREAVRDVFAVLGPVSAGTLVPDTPLPVSGGPT
jgi:hypothetical protein